jgi:hypothetical protein
MLDFERLFIRQLADHKCGLNTPFLFRYFTRWKRSQQKNRSPIIDRRPWMTFQAISFLERKLERHISVLEYGGGGSTLYFLDKGARVVTVEHDSNWFNLLNEKISEDKLTFNWTGILEIPTASPIGNNNDPSDPDSYTSESEEFNSYWFKEYASAIDSYQNVSFDIVIVDGRSRPSCIKHAADKIKIGGYLLLDNAERGYYLSHDTTKDCLNAFRIVLDTFGPTPGLSWFTKTTIWQRYR